jgi:hypothetical protein
MIVAEPNENARKKPSDVCYGWTRGAKNAHRLPRDRDASGAAEWEDQPWQ